MARLQTVLDARFIIDETPLEASDAMQFAADAMHAAGTRYVAVGKGLKA